MAQLASFDLRLIKTESLIEDLTAWLDQTDQFASREYSNDLKRLGDLRTVVAEALTQGMDEAVAKVDVMREYAKSLEEFENQGFPHAENPGVGLAIEWISSGGEIESLDNLTWERANIIWNIAAVEAHLASTKPLDSKMAWKNAKTQMERAASLIHYLRKIAPVLKLPNFSELSVQNLACLDAYLAADAQRAAYKFMETATRPPHLMCAKLAAATLPLYKESQDLGKGPWVDGVGAWGAWMSSVSQYHQAMVHQQKNELDMELARLEAAIKYAYISDEYSDRIGEPLKALKGEVRAQITVMEERRTMLWDQLQNVQIASPEELSPIPPQLTTNILDDISTLIPDLKNPYFAKIADPECREKAEIVKGRLDEWASALATEADEKTEVGRQVLTTLNLPYSLTAHFQTKQGGGLPEHLWEQIDSLQRSNILSTLQRDLWNTREAARNARFLLEKAENQLNDDVAMDRLFRDQYKDFQGFDVERMQASFRQTLDNYKRLLSSAEVGDAAVLKRLGTLDSDPKFKLLNCRKTQLDRLLPKQEGKDIDVTKLNSLLDKLSDLFQERENLVSALEDGMNDIALWEECQRAGQDVDTRFSPDEWKKAMIPAVEAAGNGLRNNIDSQRDILKEIIRENEIFLSSRVQSQGTASGDRCICMIEEGIDELDQLRKHLAEGKSFYEVILPKLKTLEEQVEEVSHRLMNERKDFERVTSRDREMAARSEVAVGVPERLPSSAARSNVAQLPVVDDEKVASLVGMDFDPELAVEALRRHNNDIEAALNDLLSE